MVAYIPLQHPKMIIFLEHPWLFGTTILGKSQNGWWICESFQVVVYSSSFKPQVCAAYCHGKFLDSAHVAELVAAARFSLSEAGFRGGARESGDVVDLIFGSPVDFPWDELVDLPIIWL